MNSYTLKKDLYNLNLKIGELNNEINDLNLQKSQLEVALANTASNIEELRDLVNKCAIFDESIITSICLLLYYNEGKNYIPFVYKKVPNNNSNFIKVVEELYVGIAEEKTFSQFTDNDNIEQLIHDKIIYEIFQIDVRVVERSKKDSEILSFYNLDDVVEHKKSFIFDFLLADYEIKNSYSVSASHYNFEDYCYVQDFIKYLFDLQIQNNGKQLNSNEIFDALKEFLKMDKVQPKQKIKEIDNKS